MNLYKQLPKLKLTELTLIPMEPDYQKFRSRVYNTENNCVAVLIGYQCPSRLYKYCDKEMDVLKENMNPDDWVNLYLDDKNWKLLQAIQLILYEIQEITWEGVASGELGGYLTPGGVDVPTLHTEPGEDFFRKNVSFNSLKFLKWMKKNDYTLPDELLIDENEKNGLQYKDAIVFGELKQTFPKHPKGKPLKQDPLFIAVETRRALMDGTIDRFHEKEKTISSIKREDRISKWIYTKYNISKYVLKHLRSEKNPQPKHPDDILSIEQVKYIFKIVNDGARE